MSKVTIIKCSDHESNRLVEGIKNEAGGQEYQPFRGPGKVYELAALQGGSSGSRSSSSGRTTPSRSPTKNNTVTVDYANLPDYDTILKNSSAGLYGSQYGHTLQMVQNMIRNGNSDAEIKNYLTQQLDGGKINEDGLATILQALGNERE